MTNWLQRLFGSRSSSPEATEPPMAPEPPTMPSDPPAQPMEEDAPESSGDEPA